MSTIVKQPEFTLAFMTTLLSERIKKAIDDSGVSVAEVATRCGVTVQAVYKWINGGSKRIDGEYLVELASVTHHHAKWIVKGEGPKMASYPPSGAHARLYKVAESLPEEQLDTLCKIGDALAQSTLNRSGTR